MFLQYFLRADCDLLVIDLVAEKSLHLLPHSISISFTDDQVNKQETSPVWPKTFQSRPPRLVPINQTQLILKFKDLTQCNLRIGSLESKEALMKPKANPHIS